MRMEKKNNTKGFAHPMTARNKEHEFAMKHLTKCPRARLKNVGDVMI